MICAICAKELKNIKGLASHLKFNHKGITKEEYYSKFLMKGKVNNICEMYGKLDSCEKYTKFISVTKGFHKYCSPRCSTSDPDIQKKKIETCLKIYDVEHAMQADIVKEIHKQTCLKNLGVDNPSNSDIIKEKKIQTSLKNWDTKHPSQCDEIQKKTIQTNLRVRNVRYPMEAKEVREKSIQTNLRVRNVKYAGQDPKVQEKMKQTNLKIMRVEHNSQCEEIKKVKKDKQRIAFSKKLTKYLNHLNLELLDEKYIDAGFKHNWKCLKCNHKFRQIWNEIQQGYTCPKCYPRKDGSSNAEKEIYKFICNLIGEDKVKHNCRNIIKNPKTNHFLELDIHIPDRKIAFEYNGVYYHSEAISPDPINSHLQKTNLCKEKGIQLIHIFEDEWLLKKDIVKSRIKQILNVNNDLKRLHIRKCEIKEIDPKIKNEFLEEFHIQGKDASQIKLGAFHNEELVSVMTFGKGNISKGSKAKEGVWELNRFCSNSNYHIPGIARKLLTHFKKNFEWNQIFSYADRRWSQGNLYYQLGFELDKITQPNYWYLKGVDRIHRFGLRKRPSEPKDIPEYLLRQKEGYTRIWDCGSLKFNQIYS